MKKSLIEIYALLVCFASMFFLIVSGAICLHGALRAAGPSITIDRRSYPAPMSGEVLASERFRGVNEITEAGNYFVVAGVAFLLHWRLAQREHIEPAVSAVS
jgi:hypothetical protein